MADDERVAVADARVAAGADAVALMEGARILGVELDSLRVAALLDYLRILVRWNKTLNLVSSKDVDRLVTRHLLDSLSVTPWLTGSRVMDLGTGAGLPGIPLAIACPGLSFTLVDRSERKIRFLSEVVGELGLANVNLSCQNTKAGNADEKFSSITARAVAPAVKVWRLIRDRLEIGGRLILLDRVHDEDPPEAEVVLTDASVTRVQIEIPGLSQVHGVMIVERC